jgi:carbohydrate-selective porin OprB
VQPFVQYIAQPDGTTAVANASILGVFLGVDF